MLKSLSNDLASLVAATAPRLLHIGGSGVSGRTGLLWSQTLAVTLAREATDGEEVPVLFSGGKQASGQVQAFDARTGLTLLKLSAPGTHPWAPAPLPAVGSLAVAVAYPSPGGIEARLDLVRFVGGSAEWGRGGSLDNHLQTDGNAYPGFSGAAVVDPEGRLIGMVGENRSGNAGYIVPIADLAGHIELLLSKGTRQRPYLGINTRPSGTDQGLALTEVEAGSPAEKAGWKAGDLLLSLASKTVTHPMQLAREIAKLETGVSVEARVLRGGEIHALAIVPGGR